MSASPFSFTFMRSERLQARIKDVGSLRIRRRTFLCRRPRREQGGETVEVVFTLLYLILLFFMVVEFSIAMYDQGALLHSARLGAREASLFWVDPSTITPDSAIEDDQRRVANSEIQNNVTAFANSYFISFADQPVDVGIDPEESTAPVSGDPVEVTVTSTYRGLVTGAILKLLDLEMSARAEARVE